METPILQSQTLIALAEFLKHWNQDPLSQNNSLGITLNNVIITNGNEILLSLQFPTENEPQIQNDRINNSLIGPNLEDYMEPTREDLKLESRGNTIDPLLEPIEENTVIPPEPENDNQKEPERTTLVKLVNDLTETRNRTCIRRDPLIGNTDSEKLREILTRLRIESRGKQREPQVRILEACYYLEQLKINNKTKRETQRLWNTVKESLGSRRASRVWKCAN